MRTLAGTLAERERFYYINVVRPVLALFLAVSLVPSAHARSIKAARQQVVAGTLRYLAVPYLWGGQNPKTGLDCSGFVQLVYHNAGLVLPRVSEDQFKKTTRIRPKDVRPGDLVFFDMKHPGAANVDHVGIYVGKGYFVQAGVSTGIHIDSILNPYYWSRLIAVRKYAGF